MSGFNEWLARLRASLGWRRDEAEMDEEFRFHLDMEMERNVRQGMTPEQARRAALVAFGGAQRYKEEGRDASRARWLEDATRDARYGLRALRRTPAFTLVAVLSLALGIGANAAVFRVVHALLLRPLPYPAPERLVALRADTADGEHGDVLAVADLRALEARSGGPFTAVGATYGGGGVTLTGMGDAERLKATWVTAGLFAALGAPPFLGRLPVAGEDVQGARRVVVVSHGFWRDRLGGTQAALGRTLTLDGHPFTVVGVMPPGFTLPRAKGEALWPVLTLDPPEARAPFWLRTIGRLAPGVSPGAARAELGAIAAQVKAQYPDAPAAWEYTVDPLHAALVKDTRTTVLVLYAAVAVLLLMATANVANLFLARAAARAPELALRGALGAGRGRLVRQLVTEGVLVGGLGGAVGMALAAWGGGALLALAPERLALPDVPSFQPAVLLLILVLSVLTGAAVGLAPALQLPRSHRSDAVLREGAAGSTGGTQRRRWRSALVVFELALALVLVMAAALIVQSLVRLQRVDPGVRTQGVLVARVTIPEGRYEKPDQVEAFYEALQQRVRALPGVQDVAVSMAVPPDRLGMTNPFTPEGLNLAKGAEAPLAEELLVSEDYFRLLDVPLLAGRAFDARDREGAEGVAIVNETLARRYFPAGEAVGRWLQTGDPHPAAPRIRVVGVVRDVKYQGLDAKPEPTIYVPYRQNRWWRGMYLLVRTTGSPTAHVAALRRELAAVDPAVPLQQVQTLEAMVSNSVELPRFRARLLAGFGVLALLLAAAGIYGLMAFSVSQRQRETGVRLALGATPGDIVRLVLGDGLRLTAAGIALGLLASLASGRVLASMLYGVSPADPLTLAVGALFLAAVGLLACAVPAVRASRTDPLRTLRAG